MANPVYSWTQVSTAMECGQKFIWRYREGIKERNSADSRPMILGSAVHKGIETYLRTKSERPTLTHEGRLILAVDAAREYIKKDTKPHQQKFDWATKSLMFDSEYYTMMTEVAVAAQHVLEAYLPHLPNWSIATKAEVMPERYKAGTGKENIGLQLALEWEIYHTFWRDAEHHSEFKGVVDAVIKDNDTGELMLVDWKVKSRFPFDELASLDGQLHLYAAVLNANGAAIRNVCMYQMLAEPPADAELGTGKNMGAILTGRASYATTWEHWSRTVPLGTDLKKYETIMRPKCKDMTYFIRPVFSPITKHSSQFALDNFQAGIDFIEAGSLPARLSTYQCQSCPFAPLCDAKRYGTDIDFIVSQRFDKSRSS